MTSLKEDLKTVVSLMAIFVARENNVINCIRDLTTIAEIGVGKPKTKQNTLANKYLA